MPVEDKAYEVMQRILKTPVPEQSSLGHPIRKTAKKRSSAQIKATKSASKELPEEIATWKARNFVDYFAEQYKIHMGGPFKTNYRTDTPVFVSIMSYFAEHDVDKVVGTKGLIDWGFSHKQEVLTRSGYMTPLHIGKLINYYFQEHLFSREVTEEPENLDNSLVNEMNALLEKNARPQEIFSEYGIPLAATYFHVHQGFTVDEAKKAVDLLIQKWSKNDRKKLGDLLRVSINNAPYPDTFVLQDWREQWKLWVLEYSGEAWWRPISSDGHGSVQHTYFAVGKVNDI